MISDSGPIEDHRYSHQQDRIIQALVQQSTKLSARIRFLEQVIDPSGPAPSDKERRDVMRARASSSALAAEIAVVGASVNTVTAAIDASRAQRTNDVRSANVLTLPRRPARRSHEGRPAGWQPATAPRTGTS